MPIEIVALIVVVLIALRMAGFIRKSLKLQASASSDAGRDAYEQQPASAETKAAAERWYRATYGVDGPLEIVETPSDSERFRSFTLTSPATPSGAHIVVMQDGSVDEAYHRGATAAERWYRAAYNVQGELSLTAELCDGYWRLKFTSPAWPEEVEAIVWPNGTLDEAHLKGVAAAIQWCEREYPTKGQVTTLTSYNAKHDAWYVDLFYDEDKPSMSLMLRRDGSIDQRHRNAIAAAERWYHAKHGTSGPLDLICTLDDDGWSLTIYPSGGGKEIDLLVSDTGQVKQV